jgi:carbamoyl-phosphate synthase small subunit
MLEDGHVFHGQAIGVPGTTFGELVFNTSATGYQEVLTDPSYRGQIVLMTYPEIGNYGVNPEDYESSQIHVAGFVVKRLSPYTSSWRAQISLQEFLYRNAIVGIEGIDTRALTRIVRDYGAMKAGITTGNISDEDFLKQVKAQPSLAEQDLVGIVSTPKKMTYEQNLQVLHDMHLNRMVLVDYGVKQSIVDYLRVFVKTLVILPSDSTYDDVIAQQPDAVLLSNGPGDPTVMTGAVEMARELIHSNIPTFGICLGHQILALACGAKVEKMKFGHHGGNHPVKDLETGQITITSQNHGYAVSPDSVPEDAMIITHINLNDHSVEGFRHKNKPVSSVQFHPEASPGPHDTRYLFRHFIAQALAQSELV